MSDQRKERCATCRWWVDPRKPTEDWTRAVVEESSRSLGLVVDPEQKALFAEALRDVMCGPGDCHAMPEPVCNVSATHWCGQWRGRG